MKVFVYSTHTRWAHHGETELEIMQNHLADGDEVYRIICRGELPVCDTNIEHRLYACLQCNDRRTFGENLLSDHEKLTSLPLYTPENLARAKQIPFDFSDIDQLKEFTVDEFDVGYAVSSSVISALRDPKPDMQKHRKMFTDFFYSSLSVYYTALQQLREHKPDVVYAFNGRMAHVKPILRAAQKLGIECRIHERGNDIFHYGITLNTTPHDIGYFLERMEEKWSRAVPEKREAIGSEFFEERIRGKDQGWFSFVKEQKQNLLPANWDNTKRNIAIFNTSEDEYESIGKEWKNFLYDNQAAGIRKILESFRDDSRFHFYLRIHPNLKGLDNRQTRDAMALNTYPNLTIIGPESEVSTYALMISSEKVITFGSSTGIEATYWGKPSILLGKSFYYNLDVAYKPVTHDEVVALIVSELQPKKKLDALKYGYYFKTFGEKFKYYRPTGFHSGEFMNTNLDERHSAKTKVLLWFHQIGFIRNLYRFLRAKVSPLTNAILKW